MSLNLQAEMQRLRDRLTISERTAKAEAQLKVKIMSSCLAFKYYLYFINFFLNRKIVTDNESFLQDKMKIRLKTLEEGLKHGSSFSDNPNAFCGSPKQGKSNHLFGILSSNAGLRKRSTSQPRGNISRSSQQPDVENEASNAAVKMTRANSFKKKFASGENLVRKSLWASRSKVVDSDEKENATVSDDKFKDNETNISGDIENHGDANEEPENKDNSHSISDDTVSGFLYDRLQKEVINLRKSCEAKDSILNAKDEEIKVKYRRDVFSYTFFH